MAQRNTIEFLNENMHSNHPLCDDCLAVDGNGVRLPTSFLADISIDTPATVDQNCTSRFFISAINRTDDKVQIEISYYPQSGTSFVCAISPLIPLTLCVGDTVDSRTFQLIATGELPSAYEMLTNITGTVIIGTCVDMSTASAMAFSYEATKLLSTVIHTHTSLDAITIQDKDGTVLHTFTSDFIIRAGDGITFEIDRSAIVPILKIKRCKTSAEASSMYQSVAAVKTAVKAALGNPIRTINGTAPTSAGDFTISGGDCTAIQNTSNGIIINNACSKPCCDASTSKATVTVDSISTVVSRLENYYTSISTNIGMIQSRLSALIAARS